MNHERSTDAGKPFEVWNHGVQQFVEQGVVSLGRFGLGQKMLDVGEVALEALRAKLSALTPDPDALREYILGHYLVLYAQIDANLYLLAIRHHRQLSFDFQAHWGGTSVTKRC